MKTRHKRIVLLPMDNCRACPNYQKGTVSGLSGNLGKHICNQGEFSYMQNPRYIPDWCPLQVIYPRR